MAPKTRTSLTIAGIALLAAAAWWVRAGDTPSADRIEVAGKVRSEVFLAVAPAIAYPSPDYSVGIPTATTGSSSGGSAGRAGGTGSGAAAAAAAKFAAMRAGMPSVSGMLATVSVVQGDRVEAGDVIATLDTTLLDLAVVGAQAAADRADADVALMGDNLDTVEDNRAKLADAKRELASGKKQLRDTRAQLTRTRADVVESRTKAEAGRSAIRAQIRQLESIPTTLTPPQSQALAALKAKLADVSSGIRKMNAGVAELDAGIAKIDAALAKMPSASTQLNTASTALSTAEDQLTTARETLRIVADGQRVALQLAKARRAMASITAPVSGVVTYVRPAGTVAMVGAPIARIRPEGPQLVDTYLTAEQLERVRVGSAVEVVCDSLPGRRFKGTVSRIGTVSEFPPTSFPTDIVHMTRAVRVTVTLPDGGLPPGTPVDLIILTR